MSVIFCDSNGELWYNQVDELGINVISMPYTIAGKEYYYDNGRKTDFKEFYDLVRGGEMPITSALNQTNYYEIFEPFFKAGEEILYISFSSKMSGTFEHMNQAIKELSEKYPDAKFTRFDTKSISMGCGMQVYLATKYFQEGHTIDETVEFLKSITNNISTIFMVDDLFHLKKGGRLKTAQAVFGSILKVKPILKFNDEGALFVFNKQKGENKAIAFMVNEVKQNYKPIKNAYIAIIQADNDKLANKTKAMIEEAVPDAKVTIQPVGPTIGTHCGPGTIGIIFPSKQR